MIDDPMTVTVLFLSDRDQVDLTVTGHGFKHIFYTGKMRKIVSCNLSNIFKKSHIW